MKRKRGSGRDVDFWKIGEIEASGFREEGKVWFFLGGRNGREEE
jgi:hypothetical protein